MTGFDTAPTLPSFIRCCIGSIEEAAAPFYAWTQDLPIDAPAYADIAARMGDSPMPGLVVHVAIEKDDGTMQYVDVWNSKQEHDAAFAAVVHPAVHPVLVERQVQVQGEPPRTPIKVVDVRFADGTTVQSPR